MSSILLPSTRIAQSQSLLPVDPSSPYADGLLFCAQVLEPGFVDATNTVDGILSSNAASVVVGSDGPSLSFSGSSGILVAENTDSRFNLSGDMTMLVLCVPNDASGGSYGQYPFASGAPNADRTQGAIRIKGTVDAAWGSNVTFTGNTALTSGQQYLIGFRRYGSSGSWAGDVLLNGVSDRSISTTENPSPQEPLALGGYGLVTSYGLPFAGSIDGAWLWARSLHLDEVWDFSRNVAQVLPDDRHPIYFDMGAASGGTTYSDSFTESISASDVHSQSAIFVEAISEGLTAADSYLQNAVIADSISYGVSASDALGHIQTILEALVESVTAGFSQSDSLTSGSGTTYSETFTESVTADYSAVTTQVFIEALSAALSVSESIADNAIYSVAVGEAISALDSFVVSDGTLTLTQVDIDAIAAAVLAAMNAAPPKVNLWNVRSQELVGNGSATPWGPA